MHYLNLFLSIYFFIFFLLFQKGQGVECLIPCEESCWHASIEGDYWLVFRNRMHPNGFLYAAVEDGDTSSYVIPNMNRMDFRFKSGIMGDITFTPTWEHTVGLAFRGLIEWEQIRKALSVNSQLYVPTFPLFTNDWTNATFMQIDYHAKFNSIELTYWNHATPRYTDYFSFAWLFGIPGIKLTDRMIYHNTTEYPVGTFHDEYKISTSNEMIGGEIGVDFENNPLCYFTWALQGKVALYANLMEKSVSLNDQNGTAALVDMQIHTIRPSYSFAFNTYIMYRMNFMHVRLGYDYFALRRIAIAPHQISRSRSLYQLHVSKKKFLLNSFYLGVGFDW